MTSALDDVRFNHPNDFAGLAFFANRANFRTPRAPMGQNWFLLKNALYFRQNTTYLLNASAANTLEHRFADTNFGNQDMHEIPNSQGGTDPATGLSVAYNLLSSSTNLNTTTASFSGGGNSLSNVRLYGDRGRRGASKIVIFETDGVPNQNQNMRYTGTGANTHFTNSTGASPAGTGLASTFSHPNVNNTAARSALSVAQMICAQTTATPAGHSTPGNTARVYAIGFGDLFEGWPTVTAMSGDGQGAHEFLLAMQKVGNTSASSDAALPERQVITGPYQRPDPTAPASPTNPDGRIEKLRDALERIFQSGVQVTLLE
jgi:hypothetical protein